jgi:hypothetical protein
VRDSGGASGECGAKERCVQATALQGTALQGTALASNGASGRALRVGALQETALQGTALASNGASGDRAARNSACQQRRCKELCCGGMRNERNRSSARKHDDAIGAHMYVYPRSTVSQTCPAAGARFSARRSQFRPLVRRGSLQHSGTKALFPEAPFVMPTKHTTLWRTTMLLDALWQQSAVP